MNFLVKGGISLDLLFSLMFFCMFLCFFWVKGGISLDYLLVFKIDRFLLMISW